MSWRLLVCTAAVVGLTWAHPESAHPGSETGGLNRLAREVLGGGHLRNFVQSHFMKPIPDITVGSAVSPVTPVTDAPEGLGVKEQTFITAPITVLNGEIVNKWIAIDWPKGHIAVKGFDAEVVKMLPDGKVPPTSPCCGGTHQVMRREAFLHHWTVNKWQLPGNVFETLVKEGGLQWQLRVKHNGLEELIAGAGLQSGANGPCWDSNLHMYFGIGNEVRGIAVHNVTRPAFDFPEPYGIEFDSEAMGKMGQFMVLNTHLIDLRDVEEHNLRACSECQCELLGSHPGDPRTTGGLTCCHSSNFDGGSCPVATKARTNQTYYIRYTIKFRDFDATVKPLEVIAFDSTDNGTKWGDFPQLPGGFPEAHLALKNDPVSMTTLNDARSGNFLGYRTCHNEYYVPSCTPGGQCLHVVHNSWELPYPIDIIFVRNHFHAGALNMTTRTDHMDICVGKGTYEDNFLVDISTCTAGSPSLPAPIRMKKGERLSVEAVYAQDHLPHYGVMAFSFVYAHVPRVSDTLVV